MFFYPHLSDLASQSFITTKKNKNKPAKGEKLINFAKDDTSSICDKYRNGAEFDRDCLLFTIQSLFNAVAVIPSLDMGQIKPANSTLPDDGLCLHIHTSCYEHKVKDTTDSDNHYHFSPPYADIGWDTDLVQYFFLSGKKAQHSALTCVSATVQMFDINLDLKSKYMFYILLWKVVYVKGKDNNSRFKGSVSYGSPELKSIN